MLLLLVVRIRKHPGAHGGASNGGRGQHNGSKCGWECCGESGHGGSWWVRGRVLRADNDTPFSARHFLWRWLAGSHW